jgi:plastocyanin
LLGRLIALILTGVTVVLGAGCATASAREVTVVARGMSFIVEDVSTTSNPVIPLRAGERVRFVLRNEAPGLLHDFVIPAWDVTIDQIRAGESRDVTFVVPNTPGRFEYRCRPHAEMMTGFVEVTR